MISVTLARRALNGEADGRHVILTNVSVWIEAGFVGRALVDMVYDVCAVPGYRRPAATKIRR
jgi:hypothetical protein